MRVNVVPAIVDPELEELLITTGGLITPVPFSLLNKFPQEQISAFCWKHAIYQVPTVELIYFLLSQIANAPAMEIGAGNGCIGRALHIKMVDNHLQAKPNMKAYYEYVMKQPIINYGADVQKNDAIRAVKIYRPDVVIGCWITNKVPGGVSISDIEGIQESLLFENGVKKYIHIGNELTHHTKPLLKTMNVKKFQFDWLLSRSMAREENVIYVFEK